MTRTVQKKANSRFVGMLAVIGVVGIALIGYAVSRSRAGITPVDPNLVGVPTAGYLVGRPDAPVQVLEFLDYECPECGNFANVTEPDVRARLVGTGQIAIHYFDFPLDMHRNTWPASNAVACAADQGKFIEMHDRVFATQDKWNSEATSNPRSVLLGLAREIGLDTGVWESCFDSQRAYPRIKGSLNEAMRRNVTATPTFVIGSRQIPGRISFDDFKKYVDEAAAAASSTKGAKVPQKAPVKPGT